MQSASRKRPAPGTVPGGMQTTERPDQMSAQDFNTMSGFEDLSNMNDDDFLNWAGPRISEADADAAGELFDGDASKVPANLSNQLVRRNQSNQIAARNNFGGQNQATWPDYSSPVAAADPLPEDMDDEELDKRAAEAKRDAQSKRPPKQIPPFIQKLSSYLENPKAEDLIRWTDDGNSFIVLDEDQFANELLPELFKHKNYPSFVRQLNMYGFHKKVGLSDNSMRASEKKARSPSEYSNPFFKRGRPELLWLISKPRGEGSKAKGKKSKDESDQAGDAPLVPSSNSAAPPQDRQDVVSLPKTQFVQFQRELQDIKRQQQTINQLINHFQHENSRFIQQASAQHERHENSINAILTFLATFYSRSVETNGSFHNMFNSAIPDHQRSQGNVTDVGDNDSFAPAANSNNQLVRQARRPLALLPPPTSRAPRAQFGSNSPAQDAPKGSSAQPPRQGGSRLSVETEDQKSFSPRVKEQSSTPDTLGNIPDNNSPNPAANNRTSAAPSNSDMMAAINSANAASPSQTFDFNSALRHFENANGNAPLTPEQRDNMLSMMANNAGGSGSAGANNMLSSLRPNATEAPLDYSNQFNSNQDQLDHLRALQREQDLRMQSIADRLQPLSPGGVIPGFTSPGSSPRPLNWDQQSGGGSDLDFGKFINSDFEPSYFPDGGNSGNAADGGNDDDPGADDFRQYGYADEADDDDDDDELFAENQTPETPADGAAGGGGGGGGGGGNRGNVISNNDLLQPGGGGRVVGSVASSSGAPSPQVEDEVLEESEGRRKRARTSMQGMS